MILELLNGGAREDSPHVLLLGAVVEKVFHHATR